MFQIRPARSQDAHTIAQVHVSAWRTAYRNILAGSYLDRVSVDRRTERWRDILANPDQVTFVAETDSGMVGFVNGGPEREGRNDHQGEIYALYLLVEFRGQG